MSLLNQYAVMDLPYLRISLTPDCNAACSFCHNDGQITGRRGLESLVETSIPLSELSFIAEKFSGVFSRVKFTGGEPTLVKELPEIISLFDNKGYDTSMTSNGFLLDQDLQERLKQSGLKSINVSVPSLDEKQYTQMFGISPSVEQVVDNLRTLPEKYPGSVKINYMAIPGSNAPDFENDIYESDQFIPLLRLSAQLSATPISVMQLVSSSNGEYLPRLLSFATQHAGPSFEMQVPGKHDRKHVVFANGGVVEHDDFRSEQYIQERFDNSYCQSCDVRDACTEGPYALRVGTDLNTAQTFLKPCLIRSDNHTYLHTLMGGS